MGERVSKYRIDVQLGDGWRTLVRGTVIGQRNLYPIATTTARRVRLVIEEAKLPPCIAEFGVRLAPLAPPPQKPPLAAN
jgi:hypothetical protein